MKQKLILFSALLIIFLLAGTANAIGDSENTDTVLTSEAGPGVSIAYNETGPFRMGDVVKITATFSEPVIYAQVKVENSVIPPVNMTNMTNISNTVWSYDYDVPPGINDAVNVTVFGINNTGVLIEKTDIDAFVIDNEAPRFDRIRPGSEYVNTEHLVFEFSAFDKLDNTIDYAIYINGTEKKTGTISSNGKVKYEIEKPDGYYQWEVKLKDDAGNIGGSGLIDLYVDTRDPSVTLVSPKDGFVNTTGLLDFNFTCQDSLSASYNLDLQYQLYIDGKPVNGGSGNMASGDYVNIPYTGLADGAHNWSVLVEDKAGNNCTCKTQKFYVNVLGLNVFLISPSGLNGSFIPADSQFNFSVSGGAGLPFDYELLVNDTMLKNGTLVVDEDGVSDCSIDATVPDGLNMPWTVRVTDCAGRVVTPVPPFYYISVDTKAPAPVANLSVTDALGYTTWLYTYDEPALHVRWDKNTEPDLADYVVLISDSKPSGVKKIFEEMEVAVPISAIYETEDNKSLFMNIGEYGGKPLVYGKDYWVAVLSLDMAYNYGFAMCGPVQTYEDMNITLDAGWNLKSVPKRLVAFNADTCSAFGKDSTVIYWNGSCWEFPKTIEPCKGYWVYSPEAGMSNVKFKPMPVSSANPDVPASLDLAPGWQMIGHTSTLPVEWSTTLASLKDTFSYKYSNLITYSQGEGWGGIIPDTDYYIILLGGNETGFNGTGPVSLLQTDGVMAPGQGYWIFMTEKGTYASIENVNVYENLV